MRREYRERFLRHRGFDPDMHHDTSVTHVPWCMPGSLTSGFLWSQWRGKCSRYSRRMRNPQFYVSGKRSMVVAAMGFQCSHSATKHLSSCSREISRYGNSNRVNIWQSGVWATYRLVTETRELSPGQPLVTAKLTRLASWLCWVFNSKPRGKPFMFNFKWDPNETLRLNRNLYHAPRSTKLKGWGWGLYWFHLVRLPVRPSVRLSVTVVRLSVRPVCGQNRFRPVSSTILAGSISHLIKQLHKLCHESFFSFF